MNVDAFYFAEREKQQRIMAENATSDEARRVHAELIARYRGLAIAAEFGQCAPQDRTGADPEDMSILEAALTDLGKVPARR